MTVPVGLQMHSVRNDFQKDFHGTLARIAEIGYDAVELGMSTQIAPEEAARTLNANGLACYSALVPLPFGNDKNRVLDFAAEIGAEQIGLSYIKQEFFNKAGGVKQVAEILNEAKEIAKAAGLRYSYHNHHFEFASIIDGRPAYDLLLDWLDDDVCLTFDVYWAQVGGVDPVDYIRRLGDRVPVPHYKDGPADSVEADMQALGDGNVDIDALIAAGEGHTRAVMVELDRCATDMWEAVAKSLAYLHEKGLGDGGNG